MATRTDPHPVKNLLRGHPATEFTVGNMAALKSGLESAHLLQVPAVRDRIAATVAQVTEDLGGAADLTELARSAILRFARYDTVEAIIVEQLLPALLTLETADDVTFARRVRLFKMACVAGDRAHRAAHLLGLARRSHRVRQTAAEVVAGSPVVMAVAQLETSRAW